MQKWVHDISYTLNRLINLLGKTEITVWYSVCSKKSLSANTCKVLTIYQMRWSQVWHKKHTILLLGHYCFSYNISHDISTLHRSWCLPPQPPRCPPRPPPVVRTVGPSWRTPTRDRRCVPVSTGRACSAPTPGSPPSPTQSTVPDPTAHRATCPWGQTPQPSTPLW